MSDHQKRGAQGSPPGRGQEDQGEWERFMQLGSQQPGEEADESQQAPAQQPQGSRSRPAKKPRRGKNSPEPDYSAVVQGHMASSNRTGQACDRCKARKMKCDSNPSGCANCRAGNCPCRQTDPITRVSYTRGELDQLRADNQRLQQENRQLRQELERLRPLVAQGRGTYPMGAQGGYSSMQGLGPMMQGLQQGQVQGSNYATQRRPSMGGRGSGQQYGTMPQHPGAMQGFSGHNTSSGSVNVPYSNAPQFSPFAPTMGPQPFQGYGGTSGATGGSSMASFQPGTQAPMTPMRGPPWVSQPPSQQSVTPVRNRPQPGSGSQQTPPKKEHHSPNR